MFGLSDKRINEGFQVQYDEIPYQDPLELFSKLYRFHEILYLLESIECPSKLAEFSFIGFSPGKLITIKNGEIFSGSFGQHLTKGNGLLETIRDEIGRANVQNGQFRLIGGAVGFISYDSIRQWEMLPSTAADEFNMPDIEMGIYDDGIVFDHAKERAYYYHLKENRLEQVRQALLSREKENKTEMKEKSDFGYSTPQSNISKANFERSVVRAKQYIFEGDVFQVVLSKRYEFRIHGNLIRFYEALRRINPSPYMFFLKHRSRQIVGSSPEMLVRVENGLVETYPIAGTRPVVDDPEKNTTLASELLSDPKERSEHVMLVDLARNDVGRVSDYGSVSVPEFMTVHQYSHVQHIVSRVVGRLSPGRDCFDALKVMLPAGTLSGAPKVRAMEIIEELEPVRRGPYAGAVGYFSFNGNADFAITIRTLVADGERAYIQVGAGIVAASEPEREWFETEHKAGALMKALEQAGANE